MNHELRKIFEPVLKEERKEGIEIYVRELEYLVSNSSESQYSDFIERIDTREKFVEFLDKVKKEVLEKQ